MRNYNKLPNDSTVAFQQLVKKKKRNSVENTVNIYLHFHLTLEPLK